MFFPCIIIIQNRKNTNLRRAFDIGFRIITTIPDFICTKSRFLKGNIKLSKDQKKFDLRNKKSQLFFIKLLNDDYLQSNLTKLFYDSLAKDQLKIENA